MCTDAFTMLNHKDKFQGRSGLYYDPHMPTKRPPKETNQLARYILEVTTGETEKIEPPVKNPHAQALSKLGASKGGQARTKNLSAKKRIQTARKADKTRWKKNQ